MGQICMLYSDGAENISFSGDYSMLISQVQIHHRAQFLRDPDTPGGTKGSINSFHSFIHSFIQFLTQNLVILMSEGMQSEYNALFLPFLRILSSVSELNPNIYEIFLSILE
jgi:hypothetical protein